MADSAQNCGNLLQGGTAMVPAKTLSTIGFVTPARACEGWGLAQPVVSSRERDAGRGDVFSALPIPVLAVP